MNFAPVSPYQAEQERIAREQALAEAMAQQSAQPVPAGQMAGQYFIPTSPLQGLAHALKGYSANKRMDQAQADRVALGQQYQADSTADMQLLAKALQGEKAIAAPSDEMGGGPAKPAVSPQDALAQALGGMKTPAAQQFGLAQLTQMQKPVTVGKTLMRPDGTVIATDPSVAAEREAKAIDAQMLAEQRAQEARDRQASEQRFRDQQARQAAADREALVRMSDQTRRDLAGQSDATRREALAAAAKPPAGYRYKPDGSMEAIPGGPADVKAQAAAQRQADGATDVDVALSTLRDAYSRLEKGGGITSTQNNPLSNAMASGSSSAIGQTFGRMFGTQNQSARNDIAMARPALLAALMKATGMSAKQMDSNAELKLWLSTATDPTLDIEANRRALDNIEKKYLKGETVQADRRQEPRGSKTVVVNY